MSDFNIRKIKVYAVTLNQVIQRLEKLSDIAIDEFKQCVEEQFEGYDYDDVETLSGMQYWPDFQEGTYELNVKIDHEDAYEFTLHCEVKEGKVSINKVL
jgi:soluble cytochrome b562